MTQAVGVQELRELLDAVVSVSSDLDLASMLRRIVRSARTLVDAEFAALGVLDPSGTHLAEFITVGVDDEVRRMIGEPPIGHGLLGLLIVDPKPIRVDDLSAHPEKYGFPAGHPVMTTFLGVPIRVRDQIFGNLYLTDKHGGGQFTDVDEELVVALAGAAAIAIENARLHARVQELALLEDRERIARDLHDTVIQRLFATGLSLQGAARLAASNPDVTARLEAAVDDLDLTVKHIRTAIFGLESARRSAAAGAGGGLRAQVLALAGEAAGSLGFEPRVVFDGPVDSEVSSDAGSELVAVLREALSNVARHAAASSVGVEVVVDGSDEVVRLVVRDDGRGFDVSSSRDGGLGLRNMRVRAERLGGALDVRSAPGDGTTLEWRAPRRLQPTS